MTSQPKRKQWFEKYPELLDDQVIILKSNGFALDETVLEKQGRIQFVGYSKADPTRQLFVAFPEAFPSCAPKVFDTAASKLLSRHHRIDNRQLCLFGFNETRWSAALSVSDALSEAEQLIAAFKNNGGNLSNEPPEPITSSLRYGSAFILVPPPISTFSDYDDLNLTTGTFRGRFAHEGDQKLETAGRGIILEAKFGDKTNECSIPFSGYIKGKEIHGDWFYLRESPTQESLPEALQQCWKRAKSAKKADSYWIALIFREEMGEGSKSRITWLVARLNNVGAPHLIRTFPYIEQERFTRIPGLEALAEKRVMLVGCGSLGSKIAANLAASGVHRFRLVDCDFYEPNNCVRHELGVEYFGFQKGSALLHRLCSLNPSVARDSKGLHCQVGGIDPASTHQSFYELVRDSDLIIDATGTHSATHFLNELSFEFQTPLIMTWVTNGAWSGEIVRVIPGKTACYLCWLDQYYDIRPPSAPKALGEVFAPGCDQPTFTGTTYDLGIVASLATSMCVETLLRDMEQFDMTKNYVRWSGKNQDGKASFSVESFPTLAHRSCWCHAS